MGVGQAEACLRPPCLPPTLSFSTTSPGTVPRTTFGHPTRLRYGERLCACSRRLTDKQPRYVLNHKKLPYRVEWVEFPDIAAVAQKVGAPPSGMGRRGPIFSIPFIYDPATSKYVSNTIDIARHLDAAYPNTPPVFPIGSEPLIAAFDDLWHEKVA